MIARFCAVLACLAIAACAATPPPSSAQLPTFFYGTMIDTDTGAINDAAWALGSPDRTRSDPVESLRAAISVEYLAGELNTAPRWAAMSPITKIQMLQARDEFRRALGIRADAPAQLVVNALIAAMVDLQRGDGVGAQQALSGPIFTQPPQQTMQVLNSLPMLPAARAATAAAELAQFRNG